jgi:2-dehydro-3-deoxygalactonokinase
MTGELYAVLRQHSILGRMMKEGKPDARAFREGIERAGEPGGLLHQLFAVRTRGLMGELDPVASASYLSGILIGHELRSLAVKEFGLIGAPELTALYEAGAALLGLNAPTIGAQAAARGLFRLGGMLK